MKASGELKDLESFHRFKLAIKQYKLIRAKAQAFTTFEQLVDWMNDEPFELFANPFLVQEKTPSAWDAPYNKITIHKVWETSVSENIEGNPFENEPEVANGPGWEFELRVYNPASFRAANANGLRRALVGWGIYASEYSYASETKDGLHSNFYCYQCSILQRDFTLSDASDRRWAYGNDILDEDDDDEDGVTGSEMNARHFEDGYSDDDIDGLFDGYR